MKFAIAFCLTFSVLTAQAETKNCTNYDQYKDVSMTEMKQIVQEKKATIIDVNSKEMFDKGPIGEKKETIHYGSKKDELAKVLPEDKDALIVAYCGGKLCTAWQRAAKAACELGYKNIKHFSEGITGWNKEKKG